jgi:tetratricopeptide (TPR) repeat protein
MFEELKRLFTTDAPPRDGLTGGDASLLDVLDLGLLRSEARAADIAAGRISAKDPHTRRLEAARVWRELARRTGDPVALRNAALGAEKAVQGFKAEGRVKAWAAARCEQALSAMLGAELYGDEGLNAAAELALKDAVAAAPSGACAAIAAGQLARLNALPLVREGGAELVKVAAAAFDAPIAALSGHLRSKAVSKALLADLRCQRAELLMAAAARLQDARLYELAVAELDKLSQRLDSAYEPLARARVVALTASARVGLGQILGGIEEVADGVEMLVAAIDAVTPDHSPLDWARLQYALAHALQVLGEGSEADRAFEHALSCYQRALWVTRDQPALALRAQLSQDQAHCLARRAELAAEPALLDDALIFLLQDLQTIHPRRDPVGWAIAQVNLAQIYIAKLDLDGGDKERAAAALALSSAIEVFGEHGLRSLIDQASMALESLEARPRPTF